jgi:hypothetical protein
LVHGEAGFADGHGRSHPRIAGAQLTGRFLENLMDGEEELHQPPSITPTCGVTG